MKREFKKALEELAADTIEEGGDVSHIWIVVAIDKNGNEGLPAMHQQELNIIAPLMTSNPENLPKMRELIKQVVPGSGVKFVIREFERGVDIEEFEE